MFVVPKDTPGVTILRNVAVHGHGRGTHSYVRYEDVRIPKDHLLGERGQGFVVAQTRLGGGRIHHAMRTVGVVTRAFEMMCERASSRVTKGEVLARKQLVQEMIADSWVQIEQFRLLVLRTAWKIDRYDDYLRVRADISAVKAAMPQVLHDVASRALQIHGALGLSDEMPFAAMVIESFHMGLADGPTEVHKLTLAGQLLKQYEPVETLFPSQHIPTLRHQAQARYAELLEARGRAGVMGHPPTVDTRSRLINAAERLFAQRGVEGVSLREINRESGARNSVALQYHFEDRAGLIQAILNKHLPEVDARRHAILDEVEAAGASDLRSVTSALVRPLAAKLADADGGREFLQIYADLLNRPSPLFPVVDEPFDSLDRWRQLVEPHLPAGAGPLHRRFTAILHVAVELGRRARSGPHHDDRLFTSYLIDVVTAILVAPVSDETHRLVGDRDRAQSGKSPPPPPATSSRLGVGRRSRSTAAQPVDAGGAAVGGTVDAVDEVAGGMTGGSSLRLSTTSSRSPSVTKLTATMLGIRRRAWAHWRALASSTSKELTWRAVLIDGGSLVVMKWFSSNSGASAGPRLGWQLKSAGEANVNGVSWKMP